MASLEFAWASIAEARAAGLDDLLALHWEEIEHHQDVSPMAVDWPGYQVMERTGRLKLGLARIGGELVGYNIFFVHRPMHSAGTPWAFSDVLYLDPAHRRGWNGVKLIKQAEADLRAAGARVVVYGVKPDRNLSSRRHGDTISGLLSRLGYRPFETSWSKAL